MLLQSRKGVLIRISVSHSLKKKDILKEIKNLLVNKGTQDSDIPTKLIKNNSDLFVDFIFTTLNDSIAQSTYPSLLKPENITSVHKKDSKSSKDHYRPVSILSNISKIYERFMFKQLSKYMSQSFQNFSAVLGKVLAPSSAFCEILRDGNWQLIIKKDLENSIWIFPRHLIASHMTS